MLIQKKLVRIITCSQYRAYTEPLMYANKMLSVSDINRYLTGTFMYRCIHKEAPEMFLNSFHTNSDFHDHDTRHSEDLHVPYGRIDVRKFSIKMHGAKLWNSIPDQIKMLSLYTRSSNNFATICLNHESSVITISSVNYVDIWYDCAYWLIMYCVGFMLISLSISSDLEAQWNPGESMNRLTMLKCTFLLTPVLLLITLVNEEVITYPP